ncbi:AraC family transcriptional regulator [Atopomonas sediminilitoris]|uniref:AraC family transcriptional regulator n=1 Tax=Atopomonas sediminilitoris TaxID=2919919 RepID=UPI001F4E52DB|nr:AraC family transcriptional regulator [Atopomonas sediminilitoris]MCJ8169874.1 AraC family transcriptional regulator [Atopomonas sediminilitoris]
MTASVIDLNQMSVSAALARAVLHAAERLGLCAADLQAQCELSAEALQDPDGRIPFAQQQRLWQVVAEAVPSATPGLAIGQNLGPGPFSGLGYLLLSSNTVACAVQAALRYQRLAGEGGTLLLLQEPNQWRLAYQPLQPQSMATRTRVQALFCAIVQLLTQALGAPVAVAAQFAEPLCQPLAAYQAVFSGGVSFAAAQDALVFSNAVLRQPLPQANHALAQVLRQHADALLAQLPGESVQARVVAWLSSQLTQGEPDRRELAQSLGMSERTLQRRLAEAGSSYQQLLTDTRRELALGYLQQPALSASEIALLLGYAEPSVFFRAFRQWTGLTPGEYRRRH